MNQKKNSSIIKKILSPFLFSLITSPVHITRHNLFKFIKKYASNIKGSILDFGCGSKPYEHLFLQRESYTGVEIKVSGPNHEVEKFGINSKVDYFYDGKTLPFKDSSFDAVVSFEVFEHIFNIDEVVKEIFRVLKPGGTLLISVPFAWNEHEVPYDFARYTSYGISHILKKSKFNIIELKKTTTYFLTVAQMFIAYLHQHVLPKGKLLKKISQILIVFPLTLTSILLDKILPRNYEYFCNVLVYSKKPD